MKIRLCYLVPFFLLLSCKHSSNPITDLSKENYDEIGELKLKGVVYDLYSPLFPQYHGYGIVRINIVQSNMEFYDPRNRLDEYLLLIKNKKAELYQPTALFTIGDTIEVDMQNKRIIYFSKLVNKLQSYEPRIYDKIFYEHIDERDQQKL